MASINLKLTFLCTNQNHGRVTLSGDVNREYENQDVNKAKLKEALNLIFDQCVDTYLASKTNPQLLAAVQAAGITVSVT